MRTARLVAVVSVLLLLCSCEGASQDCKEVLAVKLGNTNTTAERKNRTDEMREFLWTHWHDRTCGTLLFTAVSKEGKTSHSEFRITLIKPSTMMLKMTVVRDRVGNGGVIIPRLDGGFEAYMVERIVTESPYSDWKNRATVLRDDQAVPSSQYWLRFKDWEGYPISYF